MDVFGVAYAAGTSLHDASETVSAATAFWTIVVMLLSVIAFLVIRDRNSIQETLNRLVTAVEALREDLLKNYATKVEVMELHRRIDQVKGMSTQRHQAAAADGATGDD